MNGIIPRDEKPWKQRRDEGLGDATMRRTIGRVTKRLANARIQAYGEYSRGQTMRRAAIREKRQTIRDLDRYIGQAEQQIRAHGGQVFVARTAQEAIGYVSELARKARVKRVIKSKSMVTEELELNRHLETQDIVVRETDLGEYIIQLAREKPSHILAPAAHKNRAQIQELFNQESLKIGVEAPRDDAITKLMEFARESLRREFFEADMGITGGNFIVAESGTLVLITNEGNADMVTSIPEILVSIVGIEKIVASWEHLANIIQQPALSGVGQRLSSYTTFVNGPRKDTEWDGPKEWHVVLLDNGRQAIRNTPFEEVLSCIRCGACLNVCPVFRQVGGHAYGSVYSGPIGVVESPLLTELSLFSELPVHLCSMCHACQDACPMDIALPDHILQLRHERVVQHIEPPGKRRIYRAWAWAWSSPRRYRLSRRVMMWGERMVHSPHLSGAMPEFFKEWSRTHTIPEMPGESFREWWRHGHKAKETLNDRPTSD